MSRSSAEKVTSSKSLSGSVTVPMNSNSESGFIKIISSNSNTNKLRLEAF